MVGFVESVRRGRTARVPYAIAATAYLVLIFGVPLAATALLVREGLDSAWPVGFGALLAAVPTYAVLLVVVAGALSRPHQHAVKPGRLRRDVTDPVYRARRLYGLCWTSLYYATPLYFLVLSVPPLKRLAFRLFGYRGQMDFTLYPDTWIRDLPLLDFGVGAYVANRATLGTNLALKNGTLLVGPIRVGDGAMVGHAACVASGTVLEAGAEVGVGALVGCNVLFRRNSFVGPGAGVGHMARIGEDAQVGVMSYVATGTGVADGAVLSPGTITARGPALERSGRRARPAAALRLVPAGGRPPTATFE